MILGRKILANLNCSATGGSLTLACVRAVSAEQINALKVNYDVTDNDFLLTVVQWAPVIDGDELPYALTHAQQIQPGPDHDGDGYQRVRALRVRSSSRPHHPPLALDVIVDVLLDGTAFGNTSPLHRIFCFDFLISMGCREWTRSELRLCVY